METSSAKSIEVSTSALWHHILMPKQTALTKQLGETTKLLEADLEKEAAKGKPIAQELEGKIVEYLAAKDVEDKKLGEAEAKVEGLQKVVTSRGESINVIEEQKRKELEEWTEDFNTEKDSEIKRMQAEVQGETQEGTATMTSRYKESQRLLDSQNKQVELNAEAAAKRVADELKSTDGQGSTIMDEVNEVGPALNKVEGTIQEEISGVEKDIVLSDDKVKGEDLNAQEQIAGGATGEMDEMSGVIALMKSGDEASAEEEKKIQEDFGEKVETIRTKSRVEAEKLNAEVATVLENMPNFTETFVMDTKDQASQITDVERKIEETSNFTKKVIGSFQKKLDLIRKDREEQAMRLHGKISDGKERLIGAMEKGFGNLKSIIKNITITQKTDVSEKIDNLDRDITKLGNVEHKGDVVKEELMMKKINQLRQSHARLMNRLMTEDAVSKFFHQQVDKNFEEMGRGINEDDVREEAQRQEEEASDAKSLMTMEKNLEKSLAKSNKAGARRMNQAATKFGDGLGDIERKIKAAEQRKELSGKVAEEAYRAKEAKMKKALFNINWKNKLVDDALQNFTKESKSAKEYMGTLRLPLKGTTPELLKLHDQYGAMRDRMRSAGPGALLQETERTAAGARVAMMQRTGEDTAGLIRSVKALNDDLYRSNSKMIKQNAHLLNGMRFAEWMKARRLRARQQEGRVGLGMRGAAGRAQ